MSKRFYWRTTISNAIYVDADCGNDLSGDGTQQKPYQSLGKAWRGKSTKPSYIVCRGRFTEDMADGNHSATIQGDYYGAAVFDGADTYVIYGFSHANMQIKNCAVPGFGLIVNTGSQALAGVGRANTAGSVSNANFVYGVAGSPALIQESTVHCGNLGGSAACSKIIYASPRWHADNKLWFGTYSYNSENNKCTFYDVPAEGRRRSPQGTSMNPRYSGSVFCKCAFYIDERIRFAQSLIASDCVWILPDGSQYQPEGETSAERIAALVAKMDELGIADTKRPAFDGLCVYSGQNSYEILNDPDRGDYTLRIGCDAHIDQEAGVYLGALPPCMPVRILDDSTGVPACWDENTATGALAVSGGKIVYDDQSDHALSEIYSKVIKVDPSKVWLDGVYAQFSSPFGASRVHLSETAQLADAPVAAGEALPEGCYMATGPVLVGGETYAAGAVIKIAEGGSYQPDDSDGEGGALIEVLDPNVSNVLYIRSTPVYYAKAKASDGLQAGGVYLNIGSEPIAYRGREIAPGESFVAANSSETFAPPSSMPDYEVGIMFDDSRVPEQEWIPAQMFGEYFVDEKLGVVQHDADGVPISSGNYLSYQTSANGGYSNTLTKANMRRRYCQLRIIAKKETW